MILLFRLLRGRRYRRRKARRFDAANPPRPMRWRPRVKIYGLVTGLVGGLGSVVLLAQYGVAPVTNRALSTRGAVGAVLAGLVIPSLIFAVVVARFNRRLGRSSRPGGLAPRKAMAVGGLLWLVGSCAALAVLGGETRAWAVVEGPCTATLAGVDATGRSADSSSDAIEVPEDGEVAYDMSAQEDLLSWRFWLNYGPYSYVLAEGRNEPQDPNDLGLGLQPDDDFLAINPENVTVEGNRAFGSIATDEFAWLGFGLYEANGQVSTVSGQTCVGTILVDVPGNPLETVVGGVAAGATAIGLIGLVGVSAGGLAEGGELLTALEEHEQAEKEREPPEDELTADAEVPEELEEGEEVVPDEDVAVAEATGAAAGTTQPKSERLKEWERRVAEKEMRDAEQELADYRRRVEAQEAAAVQEQVSWTNVGRTVYDTVERLTTVNMPPAVRDALAAYDPRDALRVKDLTDALSRSLGAERAAQVVSDLKDAIRSLPHPAAGSVAALTSAGDHLDMWARSWAPHVQGLRASAGRALSGAATILDVSRAIDRGAQIIDQHVAPGSGAAANLGARALGAVHVVAHTALTKNPVVLVADLAVNLGTGGHVSIDRALTELEEGFFRSTRIASQTAGELMADPPVERGGAMSRDRVTEAIRRTAARSDLSPADKEAKLARLRALLGSP